MKTSSAGPWKVTVTIERHGSMTVKHEPPQRVVSCGQRLRIDYSTFTHVNDLLLHAGIVAGPCEGDVYRIEIFRERMTGKMHQRCGGTWKTDSTGLIDECSRCGDIRA